MIEKIKAKLKEIFYKHSSHDLDHTMRVHDLSIYIGKKEGADLEILKIASLLHDIGRPKQHQTRGKICHAQYGANLARTILEDMGLDKNKIEHIVHCISTHRFRKGDSPETLEAKILFDADKLDSIGAVGIGRAFMYANEVGAKLHNDEEIDIENTQEHGPEDTAFREYMVKLIKVRDKLYTKTAKEMSDKKQEIMIKFFENLNEEVWGIKKLVNSE